MISRTNKNRWGFTLVELMLAAALAAVVSYAVYKTFISGINLWEWIRGYKQNGDVAVFFEKVNQDLRNSFELKDIDFDGTASRMSFYIHNSSLLVAPSDDLGVLGIEPRDSLKRVEYIFDPVNKEVRRISYRYGETKKYKDSLIIKGVRNVRFIFYVPDAGKAEFVEQDMWIGDMPGFVEIVVAVSGDFGGIKVFKRLFEFSGGI